MKINILAFGAHPDDVELSCGGTLLTHQAQGYTTGIIDLTQGENGTRGSAELRLQEAEEAAQILGVSVRHNLQFSDGFFQNDKAHQLKIIEMIRLYQPDIVFANALQDRHPDHRRAANLVSDSCFLSGLIKINTQNPFTNEPQAAWRPKKIYFYIQDMFIHPHVVVDITDHVEQKMNAIKAFKSQFYVPENTNTNEPETYISTPQFWNNICARSNDIGRFAGFECAEGFLVPNRTLGTKNLFNLF